MIRVPRPLFSLNSKGSLPFFSPLYSAFLATFSMSSLPFTVFFQAGSEKLMKSRKNDINAISSQRKNAALHFAKIENLYLYSLKMCFQTIFIITLITFWVKWENVCEILGRAQSTVQIEGLVIIIFPDTGSCSDM